MKTKVLITGCNGFIGKNLFAYLERLDYEVYGIDVNLDDSENIFNVNINIYDDLYKVTKRILPEVIINLAARIDISNDSIWDYRTNIIGVQNLLKVTEEVESVKRVLWTSTQLVNKLGSNL